jgi:Bacteriophage minor capsid protein
MTPADVVRQLLIDAGIGAEPGGASVVWPVYAKKEPSMPDDCITVFNGPGTDDGRTHVDGVMQGLYTFQFRIRSADADDGWLKATEIMDHISSNVLRQRITVNGESWFVQCFSQIGNVIDIGDEAPNSARRLHTLNAASFIQQCGD